MTRTVDATTGRTTLDSTYRGQIVQPVAVEGQGQEYYLLYQTTYANQTTNFNDPQVINTQGARGLNVFVTFTVNAGTGVNVQVDYVTDLPLAAGGTTPFDFFNNGAHPGGFNNQLGPGGGTAIVPATIHLNWIITGTTPNVTINIWVYGVR